MSNIRKGLFAVVIGGGLAVATSAQAVGDKHATWEGYLTFTTNPPSACSGVGGLGKGDTHDSIYRPSLSGGDISFLSILSDRAGIALQNTSEGSAPQMHGTGNYTGYGVNSRAKAFTYTAGTFNFVVSPATVTTSTNAVRINGTIDNIYNAT